MKIQNTLLNTIKYFFYFISLSFNFSYGYFYFGKKHKYNGLISSLSI
jgi:hypothetical protein